MRQSLDTVSIDSDLSEALTRRLNLQISVSQLPVVEEWMDARLGRWLESVPLPPELAGPPARFLVAVASDLSRLRWSASGHPSGFIPKLAAYLSAEKVSAEEIEIINQLGEALEPDTIGSWIEVRGGAVHTGWQMLDRESAPEVLALLGDRAADLAEAVTAAGILRCTRIARQVGEGAGWQLDLELTGAPEEDALAAASAALEVLGCELSLPAGDYVDRDLAQTRVVVVLGEGAAPGSAGVRFGASPDQVAALCHAVGAEYVEELDAVRRALSSAGVVGAVVWKGADAVAVDVELVPGTQRGEPTSPN